MAGLNFTSKSNHKSNINIPIQVPNSGDSVHSTHSAGTANSKSNPVESYSNYLAPNSTHSAGTANSNSNQVESYNNYLVPNMNRPPGIAGLSAVPSVKLGHNKTSSNSSTAHTAALTPTSSVDGGASSDYHLPGITNLGSFDTDDGAHDGLKGLQALRERSLSSPGPTREFSANTRVFVPSRPRLPSKDSVNGNVNVNTSNRSISLGSTRPPLAGGSGISPHMVEATGFQSTGNRSRGASPPPNAGVISRPDSQFMGYNFSGNASDAFDSSTLRRALSNESFGADCNNNSGNSYGGGAAGPYPVASRPVNDLHAMRTFGQSAHSMGSQASRNISSDIYQRPVSAPEYYHEANYEAGFMQPKLQNHQPLPDAELANRYQQYYMQQQQQQPRGPHRRSMSMQHSSYSDNEFLGQGGQAPVYAMHQRRGSMSHEGLRRPEFGADRGSYDQRERVSSMYPSKLQRQDNRMVSPSHSPMHSSYGSSNHSGYPNDSSSVTSSPSMGLGSSAPLYGQHRLAHSDEDLSHPLAGENIEVPGEDQYYNEGMVYQRSASMGHVSSFSADSRHLPTAGASIQAPKIVYNVKFKRTQRTFEIGPRLNRHLEVGTYVKVEADRGEDLGIVIGKAKTPITRSASFGGGMGEMPTAGVGGGGDLKKIIRLATHDEVQLLGMKRKEEEELLEVCRHKVIQRGMPMVVVDAEYQFDRHKLTFFFEANTRIDFRELVRDLFSIYKTRIWMQQLDKSTSATCPTAPAPAPLVMDYGTPIIAPMSEYEGYGQPTAGSDDGTE